MEKHSTTRELALTLGDAIIAACNGAFFAIERVRRALGRTPVENITTEQLHRLWSAQESNVVLVDVRSEAEQRISVIPGAISIQAFEARPENHAGKTVVTYCTVGGRSYLYARQLRSRGIRAKNYRDSILGWVRSGYPLQTLDGRSTREIHPYWKVFRVPDDYEIQQ